MKSNFLVTMLLYKSCLALPISNDTIPSKSHLVLPEINIKGNAMVAKRRGDTLVFAADRYKQADAIRLEQLLSNIPGFQVEANGRISFNGKPIQKLMLDGDDLTAENYQLISRNLRSLMIDSIQVLERYNENRLLKNAGNHNNIAINLVLKPRYYGRPTVNLITAYATKKNTEFQKELIHLRKQLKQFVILNTNNVGAYPLQNQILEQDFGESKREVLFHSWPLVLQNNSIGSIASKYSIKNADWGLAYAGTIKLNETNRIRLNLKKSYQQMTNGLQQDESFAYDDSIIKICAISEISRQSHESSGTLDWERDKGDKSTAKYQLQFYHVSSKDLVNEVRKFKLLNNIRSSSSLYSKGIKFLITQSWAAKSNQVWLWESDVEGSTNKYDILVYRDDIVNHDSLNKILNQFVNHSGINVQTGIGYFKKNGTINTRFWLRSSFTTLVSKQGIQQLQLNVLKNYLSVHVTKSIRKKLSLEMQSMIGGINYLMYANRKYRMMYHFDHAVVWKKKATQQVSLNYGVLREGAELRKIFAGEVYLNGTSLHKGPLDLAFPLSIYGQLNFSSIDLYNGLTFGGQLQIKQIKGDYFTSVEFDPIFTRMTELPNGSESNRSYTLHVEKIIHSLRMKYKLQTTALQVKRLNQFNQQQFYTANQFYRFGNFLTTNWRKGYNVQVEYSYIQSKYNGSNGWNSRHEYKTTLQFQLSRELNASLITFHYSGKGIETVDLFDCSINWLMKSKYRLYIQGFNLLNRKYFVEQLVQDNRMSTKKQELIGRRIMIGFDIPL